MIYNTVKNGFSEIKTTCTFVPVLRFVSDFVSSEQYCIFLVFIYGYYESKLISSACRKLKTEACNFLV